MTTGHQIRQSFLDFFVKNGHTAVRSSSLVPANDPTLLFTNAGMNQFKDVFLGEEKRDYTRATTSQKCVRAGGKHNDLENVGYTRRHHTFFEMLGNFSFGDYFKAEAIDLAWTLLTKEWGMPKDKLYVTVFREDDEAEELWQKVAGVPKSRIFRLDEKDNFWQMGDTGPCGPCSEVHYDLGREAAEPGREHEEFPLDGGGRFVEIWNNVFMQFDRDSSGKLTPLPKPSIDTGMGLERAAAILQGKITNYECDLLAAIVSKAGELIPAAEEGAACLRIAADHARAAAFLIHDGVVPANDGRGYVLRKIMRRAMRHARRQGAVDPFLYKLTGFVAEFMQPAYPELMESVQRVARIVKDEEHRYATTFLVAEKMFQDEVKSAQEGVIPGSAAFKLYDTYGLALDEQEEMAREFGLAIDMGGFHSEMNSQRTRARASWKGADKAEIDPIYRELLAAGKTEFLGYSLMQSQSKVRAVIDGKDGTEVVLDRTPFYAETGGQVGDKGALHSASGEKLAEVLDTTYAVPGLAVSKIKLLGPLKTGDEVRAVVDAGTRESTMRNHTATHLLHAALRKVLGPHVKQAGSVVDPSRLRFDFSHYTALDAEELAEIERLANEEILGNIAVDTDVMDLEKAVESGAMALFGEKYADKVRVVKVGDFSKELCGGTHVKRTGDIGLCKVVYEGSISAGVRRLEAITGAGALERFRAANKTIHHLADLMKTNESDLVEHTEKLIAQHRTLERQVEQLKEKLANKDSDVQPTQHGKLRVFYKAFPDMDRTQLRTIADNIRAKSPEGTVVFLGTSIDGRVVAATTKDVSKEYSAGALIKWVTSQAGGKGGGRPDLAEGSGVDLQMMNEEMLLAAIDGVKKG